MINPAAALSSEDVMDDTDDSDTPGVAPSSRLRVLHVEDNPAFVRLLQRRMQIYNPDGPDFIAVHSLNAALARMDEILPDVALVDLGLPDALGLDAVCTLRRRFPALPIVVLSGTSDEQVLAALIREGAQDYLSKDEQNMALISRVLHHAIDRIRLEQQLQHMARIDSLTQLANRALFMDRLESAVRRAQRFEVPLAVLYVDLDHFKPLNDDYGHRIGDAVLVQVANNMREVIRETDTVGRLGGDEFCVLVEGVETRSDVELIAEKVRTAINIPAIVEGVSHYPTASLGIVVRMTAEDDSAPGELLRRADMAMYRAKAQGGNRAVWYESGMEAIGARPDEHTHHLRHALAAEQFEVFFQPQYDAQRQCLHGAEVLLRWRHPELGLLTPAHFLDALESSGLILGVTDWVLENACQWWLRWRDAGCIPQDAVLAVNLSPRVIQRTDVVERVQWILDRVGFPPHLLELEITESAFISRQETTLKSLNALRDMGVGIAIDDFGTGYSSMSYLKHFRPTCLKLDRAFVDGIASCAVDRSIAKSIKLLADELQLTTVAEGVDALEKIRVLRDIGYTVFQGYTFSKPRSAYAFRYFLSIWEPLEL